MSFKNKEEYNEWLQDYNKLKNLKCVCYNCETYENEDDESCVGIRGYCGLINEGKGGDIIG